MAIIEEEMKEVANYAIKTARDRYKCELDFSENSLINLDNILTKIYWGFSGSPDKFDENGLVYNTAMIWGSYLGEYMISKWGGKWIQKGSERLVSINNIEFFPIKLIYQKISDRPQLSVEDYINDTKRIIYTSAVNPQNVQQIAQKNERLRDQINVTPAKESIRFNRRAIYIIGGIIVALVIIAGITTGYAIFRRGGILAISPNKTSTNTSTQPPTRVLSTATLASTDTPIPTVTPLPTYTAQPTETTTPTLTPSLTNTELPSSTPTDTETPTPTITPRPTFTRTYTPVPPTNPPPPPPTAPPVVIESCEVNPSTVASGINQKITFVVRFSAPGYQFTANNEGSYNRSGCTGVDDNGDNVAYCDGSSGELPDGTIIDVLITSVVGNCTVRYQSP